MKSLNELTIPERLELYKKALKDWTERPNDEEAYTDWGLCFYFENKHNINAYENVSKEFMIRVLDEVDKSKSVFIGEQGDPIPRIAALEAMIKDLEGQNGE